MMEEKKITKGQDPEQEGAFKGATDFVLPEDAAAVFAKRLNDGWKLAKDIIEDIPEENGPARPGLWLIWIRNDAKQSMIAQAGAGKPQVVMTEAQARAAGLIK